MKLESSPKGIVVKLRFEVDQAECLRAGIDCPKSIVTVEVDPAKLSQDERDLLADRLSGIDVCELGLGNKGQPRRLYHRRTEGQQAKGKRNKPWRIVAKAPTYSALMDAVREDTALFRSVSNQRQGLPAK